MRSRYAAYASGRVDHIVATTDPDGPQWREDAAWHEEIRTFCARTRFVDLEIDDAPDADGDEGVVAFTAHLVQDGRDAVLVERSRFVRRDGRWLYHGALS